MHQYYIEPKNPKAKFYDEAKKVMRNKPVWAESVPYQIKRMAVKQACDAVKAAKKKFLITKEFQEVKLQSKKKRVQSVYIPKSAVSSKGLYYTVLGELHMAEPVTNAQHDCRLLLDNGAFYLVMPCDKVVPIPENQRLGIVALDPGVRTFQTFYNPNLAGKIGAEDFARIYRLCYAMDKLISKRTRVNAKARYRIGKAIARVRIKIKCLISEIHHKASLFFAKHFDAVVIPPFETSKMVTKLRSKTARAMLGWSHYRFRQILTAKCEEYSTTLIIQEEAYTSKTCGACGHIHNVGGKRVFNCPSCGAEIDRDINGARNIYNRAVDENVSLQLYDTQMSVGNYTLGDTPSLSVA